MTDTTTPDVGAAGIRIQCSELPDGERPKPYYILPTAQVSRQDVWRGNPNSLLGFQRSLAQEHVDLTFDAWWRDRQSAVGLYPVFVYRDTGITVHKTTVERVTVAPLSAVFRAGDGVACPLTFKAHGRVYAVKFARNEHTYPDPKWSDAGIADTMIVRSADTGRLVMVATSKFGSDDWTNEVDVTRTLVPGSECEGIAELILTVPDESGLPMGRPDAAPLKDQAEQMAAAALADRVKGLRHSQVRTSAGGHDVRFRWHRTVEIPTSSRGSHQASQHIATVIELVDVVQRDSDQLPLPPNAVGLRWWRCTGDYPDYLPYRIDVVADDDLPAALLLLLRAAAWRASRAVEAQESPAEQEYERETTRALMSERDLSPTPGSCECGPPGSVATEWVEVEGAQVSMCLRCGKARD